MARSKRRRRIGLIAGFLMTGAIVLQIGPLCAVAGGTGLVSAAGTFIDSEGRLFGLFDVCGQENIVYVDSRGIPSGVETQSDIQGSLVPVLYSGDDLMRGCPVRYVRPGL